MMYGVEVKNQNGDPMVTVSENGPYLITGGIDLIGVNIQWAEGSSKEHYTLCRCGASNNKPFVMVCTSQLILWTIINKK